MIEQMGGASKTKAFLEKEVARHRAAQMTMESLMFPEKPTLLKSDARKFAIVPTKYILAAKGQREEFMNYLIGVKDNGAAKWTFIDTSAMNTERLENFLQKFFPDFPANYRVPSPTRRKL